MICYNIVEYMPSFSIYFKAKNPIKNIKLGKKIIIMFKILSGFMALPKLCRVDLRIHISFKKNSFHLTQCIFANRKSTFCSNFR